MRHLLLQSPTGGYTWAIVRALLNQRVMQGLAAVACALLLPVGVALAQDRVFRCTNSEGKTAFQAQECATPSSTVSTQSPQAAPPPASAARVRPPSPNTAPQVVKPDAATPAVGQWARGADVIVVSGYGAHPVTQVNIAHTAKPVMLVLATYKSTRWTILPAAGTRIRGIVVASFDDSKTEVQAPPGVPVLADKLPYAYKSANINFRELMSKLHARYGVERVLGLRGSYDLPAVISVTGPFLPDPHLTLEGMRPEAPRVRFSFTLPSIDGRKLLFTNTGPTSGNRYTGIVRGAAVGFSRGKTAAVGEDGRETYYLEGNGSSLVWAPDGFNGRTEKIALPSNFPRLSWVSGLAWDTRKGVLVLVSFGGEGYLYRYDTRQHTWLDVHSMQDRDFVSVSVNPKTGDYFAISDSAELARFNELGEVQEIVPLKELLADLDSTYDRGNERIKNLVVAADGDTIAVVNVFNGSVTHIWTYDEGTRKAQLTYKATE